MLVAQIVWNISLNILKNVLSTCSKKYNLNNRGMFKVYVWIFNCDIYIYIIIKYLCNMYIVYIMTCGEIIILSKIIFQKYRIKKSRCRIRFTYL